MFKKEMQEKLKAIFGVSKVTFDEPGDSFEQDCIFVEIEKCVSSTGEGLATSKVSGNIVMFSEHGKLPFGFFNKRIQQSDSVHTAPFFFFDMDVETQNSQARFVNVAERRVSFVYLYSGQYDPNQGEMTSVVIE